MRLFTIILTCEKYRDKMLSQDTSKLDDYMYFIGDPKLSSPVIKWKGSTEREGMYRSVGSFCLP